MMNSRPSARKHVAMMPQIRPALTCPRLVHVVLGSRFISAIALLPFDQANGPRIPQINKLKMPSTRIVVPSGCSRAEATAHPLPPLHDPGIGVVVGPGPGPGREEDPCIGGGPGIGGVSSGAGVIGSTACTPASAT